MHKNRILRRRMKNAETVLPTSAILMQYSEPLPTQQRWGVVWLQGITLAWMLMECTVSLRAALSAHSPVLAAFGADSLVELLSACVVLASFLPRCPLTKDRASRWAGILLFVLAAIIGMISILSIAYGMCAETSIAGLAITSAALVVMPLLAWLKRHMARATGNRALAADAVQSVTCAYLAALTIVGLAANAAFHISWIDPVAALLAIPLLVSEGRKTIRGEGCSCCDTSPQIE
jgi:divalent metal cation (Fe/Co/Zn/Cd) transporter